MSRPFGFARKDGPPAEGLQETTLAVFTLLLSVRDTWPGALIASCGLGPLGSAVALAANVAGAACLSIESDAAICRAAMRIGACDFLVNTVDESLRVLKNEIRQKKPLSVALNLNFEAALGELLERGVLPELFTSTLGLNQAVLITARDYAAQGALVVDLDGSLAETDGCVQGEPRLQTAMATRERALYSFDFTSSAELRNFDARLLELWKGTEANALWVAAARRLFHRERPFRRMVLLTQHEAATLDSSS